MLERDVHAAISAAVEQLVALGSEQGYVTVGDVVDRLPEVDDEPDLLDLVASRLETADVELARDDVDAARGTECDELEGEIDELVDARPVSLEGIDSDDTISLYFREVGSVPLLSREEEVALAKRIERGRRTRRRMVSAADLPDAKRRQLERPARTARRRGTTWSRPTAAW